MQDLKHTGGAVREMPETVGMDLPAKDGTLLRLTLHRDEEVPGGGFTDRSLLEVQEHTAHGLRPLVSYRVNSVLNVEGDLTLHSQCPGLTIERYWLITLDDWMIMMIEESATLRRSTS